MRAPLFASMLMVAALAFARPAGADSPAEIQAFVKKAEATVETFAADDLVADQLVSVWHRQHTPAGERPCPVLGH